VFWALLISAAFFAFVCMPVIGLIAKVILKYVFKMEGI
jgi:hypothetical protein